MLSYVIDALRRIGTPTQKSALRRQDQCLKGLTIVTRGQITSRHEGEAASGFHAVVEPIPESVSAVTDRELEAIRENAARASKVLEIFRAAEQNDPLDGLDRAFECWLNAIDRRGYTDADIVEILGASFGELCISRLGMRWVRVSDQYGTTIALDGLESCFRGFPYDSVSKRIADHEHTFFRGIFLHLAAQKQSSMPR